MTQLPPGGKSYVQERDSWFKHSIVLNGLSYGIARLFDSFVPSQSMIEGTTSIINTDLSSFSLSLHRL